MLQCTPVMRSSDALSQALMRLRDSLMSCRYTVVAGYSGSCSPEGQAQVNEGAPQHFGVGHPPHMPACIAA